MNYEEQILELRKRIEVLEKAEKKRITKKKLEITLGIVKFLVIVIVLVVGWWYLYNNYIKPYKEKIDYFEEKVDTVENFVSEKWDTINKYNPFA